MEIDRAEFLGGVAAIAESVYSFHERFEIGYVDSADRDGTLVALRRRLPLLVEEMGEHARALNGDDVEDATSEAADILYIAIGTILRLGHEGVAACRTVAGKNDAKAPSTHGKQSSSGKVLAHHRPDGGSGERV